LLLFIFLFSTQLRNKEVFPQIHRVWAPRAGGWGRGFGPLGQGDGEEGLGPCAAHVYECLG